MKLKVLNFFCLILFLVSCKNTEVAEISPNDEIKAAFNNLKGSTTAKRDIAYSPQWQSSVDFEGSTYIPLTTDKRIFSYTSDSVQYSLDDKIWLKAIKQDTKWRFFILTVFPDSPVDSKKSGIFLYEDWKTGQFSYEGYIEDRLYNPAAYNSTLKLKGLVKKSHIPPPCKFINSTVCAGEGPDQSCTTRSTMVCSDATGGGGAGTGGGDTGGGGGGGTGPSTPPIIPEPKPPTEAQIKAQLKDKPFALIPNIPCDIIKKWIATAKFTVDQSTLNRLIQIENTLKPGNDNSYLTNVQNINNAYSTVVNMDYFPITVNMMPLINGKVATPEQFLEHIRKNVNKFVNTGYSEFNPYVYSGVDDTNLWNSSNPKNAVVAIDIGSLWGTGIVDDNGSVIVSKYNSSGWTFTTIHEPMYGDHPVSGNRDFGFVKNSNGSYTFYTRGVDRLTNWDADAVNAMFDTPFDSADALWKSFQNKVSDFVNLNGGNAGSAQAEIHRPDWSLVKDVIDGKKPLSALSTDCK